MKLTFTSLENANSALTEVNKIYGCPYISPDRKYWMDTWALITKHKDNNLWEFETPQERINKNITQLKNAIKVPYQEVTKLADDWAPKTEDV